MRNLAFMAIFRRFYGKLRKKLRNFHVTNARLFKNSYKKYGFKEIFSLEFNNS